MSLPRPTRERVTLVNDAGEATPHTYVRTERVDKEGERPGFAFFFRCAKTGAVRQYGLVGAEEIASLKPRAEDLVSEQEFRARSRLLGSPTLDVTVLPEVTS